MRLLRDLQRKKKMESRKKMVKGVAIGTLVGSIVGSAAGILFAPDSGKNTRKKIQDNTENVKDQIHKNVEKATDHLVQAKNSVSHKKTEIRAAVDKIRNMKKRDEGESIHDNEDFTEEASDENSK
ncbi:YtxH domain-containing protein [Clostridiaceae bacterium 35-E11]